MGQVPKGRLRERNTAVFPLADQKLVPFLETFLQKLFDVLIFPTFIKTIDITS